MDYKALGLVAGIEIHQQLDTKEKLFCHCPTTAPRDRRAQTANSPATSGRRRARWGRSTGRQRKR